MEEAVGHLGRSMAERIPQEINSAAVFLVLPPGETEKLKLEESVKIENREGEPTPVVLQLRTPKENRFKRVLNWTQEHERALSPGESAEFEIFVYHFGDRQVNGTLRLADYPKSWRIVPKVAEIVLKPMDRKRVALSIHRPEDDAGGENHWLEWEFSSGKRTSANHFSAHLCARIIDPESSQ